MTNETKEKIEHFLKGVKTWSFNIKFNTSESNITCFKDFKQFCKSETDNNYLLGIKKLLENYETDYKYNSLYDLIEELQVRTNNLKQEITKLKTEEKKDEEETQQAPKTFGV